MRILVTGGAGYLGSALLRHLQSTRPAYKVLATYHSIRPAAELPPFVQLDLCDFDSVDRFVRAFHPEVIVNTAARMQGSLEALRHVNSETAGHLARASGEIGARFVHLSTDVVFDGSRGNYNEEDDPNPLTDYGKSKLEAEIRVATSGAKSVIVRTSLIYGFSPLDPRTRAALSGEAPLLFTDELRCPIWVETLSAALAELCEGDHTGILHVAGGQVLSRYDLAVKLVRKLGGEVDRLKPGLSVESGLIRPLNCTLDCSKARGLLETKLLGVDQVLDLATY